MAFFVDILFCGQLGASVALARFFFFEIRTSMSDLIILIYLYLILHLAFTLVRQSLIYDVGCGTKNLSRISVPVGETYLVKSHACDFLTDDYVFDVIPPKRNGLTAANFSQSW